MGLGLCVLLPRPVARTVQADRGTGGGKHRAHREQTANTSSHRPLTISSALTPRREIALIQTSSYPPVWTDVDPTGTTLA
ncbi:hypothetical protein BC628DRAFT_931499 [Trametes gibbosa]|nr:hypothetical protein BC628DRAFT_931499 [Trametes gibbosa]